MKNTPQRRTWLRLFALAPLLLGHKAAAKLAKTASASDGPYYPSPAMRHRDSDNDLVKIESSVREAGGDILSLSGTVTDTAGAPLAGLRVEIWQCDVNGRYLHTADSNGVQDRDFQGFGHTFTNQSGHYEFRTIRPVSYPGRAPHIHVKVFGDEKVLTTQFYLKGHPENARDSLYRRLTPEQRLAVEMDLIRQGDGSVAEVNLVC